jgi:hypothetical protein
MCILVVLVQCLPIFVNEIAGCYCVQDPVIALIHSKFYGEHQSKLTFVSLSVFLSSIHRVCKLASLVFLLVYRRIPCDFFCLVWCP